MDNPVHQAYGNRVRVRACGICIVGDALVMVNHRYLTDTDFWAPPGGGIEFGEDAAACLAREFSEETSLKVDVGPFLFACELVKPPLHAIELFFHVVYRDGELKRGTDPETRDHQIIKEVRMLTAADLRKLGPGRIHGILSRYPDIGQITALRGYFKL